LTNKESYGWFARERHLWRRYHSGLRYSRACI